MVYDPAWDMPKVNWQPQGSYEPGEIPLAYAPDEGPLVCLPPINRYWLPLVLGCLDQLRNPSTWIVSNDDAMFAVLSAANRLMQMIGGRAVCPVSFALQVSGCELQYSTDDGETWTEVSGWGEFLDSCIPPQTLLNFTSGCSLEESLDGGETYLPVSGWLDYWAGCVQDAVPIVGLPPNPGDQEPDQLACSIAAYLSSTVVLEALSQAVTAIQDDLTLLTFGTNILDFIPEFVLVRLGYDAIALLYTAVSEGTLTDYQDSLDDTTLWLNVQCAIYAAIQGDGYVTPGNFAAIIANVEAISYVHADVITAIVAYLNSLGAVGLAQLAQKAGLETGANCADCATWCQEWDYRSAVLNATLDEAGRGQYTDGVGWTSLYVAGEAPPAQDITIDVDLTYGLVVPAASVMINQVNLWYSCVNSSGGALRNLSARLGGTVEVSTSLSSAATPGELQPMSFAQQAIDTLVIFLRSAGSGTDGDNVIETIQVLGVGTNPYTDPSCPR